MPDRLCSYALGPAFVDSGIRPRAAAIAATVERAAVIRGVGRYEMSPVRIAYRTSSPIEEICSFRMMRLRCASTV